MKIWQMAALGAAMECAGCEAGEPAAFRLAKSAFDTRCGQPCFEAQQLNPCQSGASLD